MMSTKKEKNLEKFIRERGLYSEYKREEKIKSSHVKTYKYDATIDGRKQNLLLYRKNNKTIILDRKTLEKRGQSNKNIENTKKSLSKEHEKKRIIAGKERNIIKRDININIVHREKLTNKYLEERNRPLRHKVGQIYINITWFSKEKKQTTEGGSGSPKLLDVKSEYDKAFDEAYRSALRKVNFSPQRSRINWIHYAYYFTIKKKR